MSETDKYEALAAGCRNCGTTTSTAAYLREHFVTREEYEASVKGERLQMEGKHKEAEEVRRWFTKAQEWGAELAALTAERDRLRVALEGIKQIVHRRQLPITHQVYDAVHAALNPEDV